MRPAFRLLCAVTVVLVPTAIAGSIPLPTAGVVVTTGPAPCGAARHAGSIWIGVYETGRLLELDDRSGHRQASVPVGRWACRVAVGPAAVWVTRDRAGELVRVSRGTGRLRRVTVAAGVFDVLLAKGSVWATSYDTGAIARIDPSTTRLRRVYRDGPNPAGLASCGGRVWIGHGRDATWITSIDPDTHRVRRIPLGVVAPGWPECIRGIVWVTTPDSVVRIDPTSGRVLSNLRIGETLAHAAEGPDGLIWVTDKQHSVVLRLSPDGASVLDSFPAGAGAFALVRAGSAMWVTSFAGSDIRRFDR